MNPFEFYPLPEGVVPEAPNWSELPDGSYVRRIDGVTLRRSNRLAGWELALGEFNVPLRARDVGSVHDLDAMRFVDLGSASNELRVPHPPPACGQVWAAPEELTAEGPAIAEVMVRSVARFASGKVVVELGDEMVEWSTVNGALVAGPWSPWVPPGWTPPAEPPDGETQGA